MVVEERLVTYINSLETGNTEILDEIEREALRSDVPIIRKEMQTFLKVFLAYGSRLFSDSYGRI